MKEKDNKKASYEKILSAVRHLLDTKGKEAIKDIPGTIQDNMHFWWTGFYWVDDKGENLTLGAYVGPPACELIRKGKGVCGTSWIEDKTIIVPNVEDFPGHIACSSESRSEIVVPIRKEGKVLGVLDIDSRNFNNFDDTDASFLEEISDKISDAL